VLQRGGLATSTYFAGYLIPKRITVALNDRDRAQKARDDAEPKARDEAIEERNNAVKAARDAAPDRPPPAALIRVPPPITVTLPRPFDPKSDSNSPNVTPTGQLWSDDDICKGYQIGKADDWRARWLGQRDVGTYIVWVYSDTTTDETDIQEYKIDLTERSLTKL
jgi:hypothetical protein